jgi:hypothetical protein
MMTGTNGVARTATAGAKAIVHNPSRLRIFYPSSSSFRRRIAIIVNPNSRGSVAPIGAAARRAELGIVDRSAPSIGVPQNQASHVPAAKRCTAHSITERDDGDARRYFVLLRVH